MQFSIAFVLNIVVPHSNNLPMKMSVESIYVPNSVIIESKLYKYESFIFISLINK